MIGTSIDEHRIVNQAILGLGNIVGESSVHRDVALKDGALTSMIAFEEKLVKIVICNSNCCRCDCDSNNECKMKGNDNYNVTSRSMKHNVKCFEKYDTQSTKDFIIVEYLDNTTWAILNLFRNEPAPKLMFRKQAIKSLANVLTHITDGQSTTSNSKDNDNVDDNHNCKNKGDLEHKTLTIAKMTIVKNTCWSLNYILQNTNLEEKEDVETDNDNDNDGDLQSKSMLELLKDTKILEYIMQLVTDSRMTNKERHVALTVLAMVSSGGNQCIDYILKLGVLDKLAVWMNSIIDILNSNNKLNPVDICVLKAAFYILANVACDTERQCLQLIEHKELDIVEKAIIILNHHQECNDTVDQCVYVIQKVIRSIFIDKFTKEMSYLVNKTSLLTTLSKMLDTRKEYILKCVMQIVDDILSFGQLQNEKYLTLVGDAGIFEKVSLIC